MRRRPGSFIGAVEEYRKGMRGPTPVSKSLGNYLKKTGDGNKQRKQYSSASCTITISQPEDCFRRAEDGEDVDCQHSPGNASRRDLGRCASPGAQPGARDGARANTERVEDVTQKREERRFHMTKRGSYVSDEDLNAMGPDSEHIFCRARFSTPAMRMGTEEVEQFESTLVKRSGVPRATAEHQAPLKQPPQGSPKKFEDDLPTIDTKSSARTPSTTALSPLWTFEDSQEGYEAGATATSSPITVSPITVSPTKVPPRTVSSRAVSPRSVSLSCPSTSLRTTSLGPMSPRIHPKYIHHDARNRPLLPTNESRPPRGKHVRAKADAVMHGGVVVKAERTRSPPRQRPASPETGLLCAFLDQHLREQDGVAMRHVMVSPSEEEPQRRHSPTAHASKNAAVSLEHLRYCREDVDSGTGSGRVRARSEGHFKVSDNVSTLLHGSARHIDEEGLEKSMGRKARASPPSAQGPCAHDTLGQEEHQAGPARRCRIGPEGDWTAPCLKPGLTFGLANPERERFVPLENSPRRLRADGLCKHYKEDVQLNRYDFPSLRYERPPETFKKPTHRLMARDDTERHQGFEEAVDSQNLRHGYAGFPSKAPIRPIIGRASSSSVLPVSTIASGNRDGSSVRLANESAFTERMEATSRSLEEMGHVKRAISKQRESSVSDLLNHWPTPIATS
mmetsp:Transcript_101349/g.285854  ORF Transcript_101349/g.285854 Transcript_101349/m.285854 type:complete len:677 (-) Transcript_101349:75-2105(-)